MSVVGLLSGQGLFVLVSFLILGSYSQDIFFESHGSRFKNGCEDPAQCILITSCPSALQSTHQQKPSPCGFIKTIPMVCCQDAAGEDKNAFPGTDSPAITAPPVNFECGKRSTRVVPQKPSEVGTPAGTLVRRRRVIGGSPVSATSVWPWLAVVGERKGEPEGQIQWYCVASLINDKWLITAAHCFLDNNLNVVRLGEHDYSDPLDGADHQDFDVAEVLLHPNNTFPTRYDDLALIRLRRPAEIKATISPVCLPWGLETTTTIIGRDLLLVGWGTTIFGGDRSPFQNEVNMTVFEPSVCNNSYSELRGYSLNYPRGIDHTFLCMGHPQGGISACQGDSGGPLMYYNSDGRYVLAGIVSSGYGCGHPLYPGVHTNLVLESRLAWIKKVAFS